LIDQRCDLYPDTTRHAHKQTNKFSPLFIHLSFIQFAALAFSYYYSLFPAIAALVSLLLLLLAFFEYFLLLLLQNGLVEELLRYYCHYVVFVFTISFMWLIIF